MDVLMDPSLLLLHGAVLTAAPVQSVRNKRNWIGAAILLTTSMSLLVPSFEGFLSRG